MSVATAVVGSAVVGGYLSSKGADKAAKASERGAQAAADSTLEATQLQIEEIRRQFDYQMQVLQPQIQQQYQAQSAYAQMMGLPPPPQVGLNPVDPASIPQEQYNQEQQQLQQQIQNLQATRDQLGDSGYQTGGGNYFGGDAIDAQIEALQTQLNDSLVGSNQPPPGSMAPAEPVDFTRREDGSFVDPNLTSDRFSDRRNEANAFFTSRGHTGGSYHDPDSDMYRNYITDNGIAAATLDEDLRYQRARDVTMSGERGGASLLDARGNDRLAAGAAGTGVYGDVFQESPGYAFAVEEMNRALDRRRSAGGNYGGRAIMEAQRRAQGLANQDYYNWAAGRERDLGRLGAAEAADAGRFDRMAQYDIGRGDEFARIDMARGDAAVDAYEGQRVQDVMRGDSAYQNWLARRSLDTENALTLNRNMDAREDADITRDDQSYYNYMANLGAMSGFGNPAAQAVGASQAAGSQVAGAYGNQGSALAAIYANQGNTQATIQNQQYANINNAVQSGIGNWITAGNAGYFGDRFGFRA